LPKPRDRRRAESVAGAARTSASPTTSRHRATDALAEPSAATTARYERTGRNSRGDDIAVPPAPTDERRLAAAKAAAYHCGAFPTVPTISADELVRLRDTEEKVVVVDTRSAAERRVARIPGALSKEEFEMAIEDCQDATVVCYCTVGRRSGAYAARLAKSRACKSVLNSEGILMYSYLDAAGTGPHALVDELGAPATRIHVYASPWDLASERFESVKFGVLGAIGAAFE